jgi:hypothetical protein
MQQKAAFPRTPRFLPRRAVLQGRRWVIQHASGVARRHGFACTRPVDSPSGSSPERVASTHEVWALALALTSSMLPAM